MQRNIKIYDVSLRDGNHAARHSITKDQIKGYARLAEEAGVDVLEVGHGNGLGASSLQLGFAATSDMDAIATAQENLSQTKLGIHVIPGFAKSDEIVEAIAAGVSVVRVAAHCTEANVTSRYIELAKRNGAVAYGVLMMSHMATPEMLLEQARVMCDSGADAIVLMDSAGAYVPKEVCSKVSLLVQQLRVPIGFHAHNNLGLAVANSIVAAEAGASIIDGAILGFGAGAGNAPLEVMVAVLEKEGFDLVCSIDKIIDAAEAAAEFLMSSVPSIRPMNLLTGLNGLFSGFEKPIQKAGIEFNVDVKKIMRELRRRQIIAGQEDIIIEVAQRLSDGARAQSPGKVK